MLSRELISHHPSLQALQARNGYSATVKDQALAAVELWSAIKAKNVMVKGQYCGMPSVADLQFRYPSAGADVRLFYSDQLGRASDRAQSFSPRQELPKYWSKELTTVFDRFPDHLTVRGYNHNSFKKQVNVDIDSAGVIYVETTLSDIKIGKQGFSQIALPGTLYYRFKLTPEDALRGQGLRLDKIVASNLLLEDLYFSGKKYSWNDRSSLAIAIEYMQEEEEAMRAFAASARPKR
ncbi:MAG: hypothetical protein A3J38_01275 [Gammaproteobacteria bacterium RIFCSPHIGHO2_12_FULL_45_9]|nr:MAG: hypothetical protein A3J38_01275 [Gammaproteobacteria bacterium RIFCSPHIGHO2_12_FULL_45_9]